MRNKVKGPYDFEQAASEVVETYPVLKVNDQAGSVDFLTEIQTVLGETEAILVLMGASLVSARGTPTRDIVTTALWSIQRQFALMRRYLDALRAGPQRLSAPRRSSATVTVAHSVVRRTPQHLPSAARQRPGLMDGAGSPYPTAR